MFTQHFHLIFYDNLLWSILLSKIIKIMLISATNKRKVSENHRFLRLPGKSGYKSTCGWGNRRRFGQMASYRFRHRKQSILSADPRGPPIQCRGRMSVSENTRLVMRSVIAAVQTPEESALVCTWSSPPTTTVAIHLYETVQRL